MYNKPESYSEYFQRPMQPIYLLTLGKAIYFLADATADLKQQSKDSKDADNTTDCGTKNNNYMWITPQN